MSEDGVRDALMEKEEDKKKREESQEVYDGGWGWCVVAGWSLLFSYYYLNLNYVSMFSMQHG